MVEQTPAHGAVHVVWLWAVTILFAFRVAAQAVQLASPTAVLPPFDAWQGSGLDYPALLVSQLLILGLMVSGATRVSRGLHTSRRAGIWLLALGGVYFAAMAVRLLLGLTVLAHVSWFAKPLPALFHLVLAGYLLTVGHYHLTRRRRT